ncbi:glycosyltransferase [Klenkia taihuensis]|uniref:Glycosyltransferase involved in cell wall bisynthesis n=1 Tax=Klenkia taihuensis TaxID=1225127 RepID=A0A1I1QI01_9ACTN|nr:glycosyltransferase [Klenkia taihuensis]GHE07797.1 glycosyl transferase [Klenkia taihuensis]SFD21699.1 Glycosyltransferase involved in cell wall bisynthesis [Klenkia taihuensis]
MRVDLVSEHASPLATLGGEDAGGQNVHVAMLARALAARGHDVVVHTRRDDVDLPPAVDFAPGVVVRHLDAGPPKEVPKDQLWPHVPELAAALRTELLADPPDVVHAHFWMSGRAAVDAAHGLGVPVAQTFHALGSVKRRWQGTADTSPPVRIRVETAVARRAAGVIATCADEVDELAALGVDRRKVTVVPSGVDTGAFTPDGPRVPRAGRPRLLVVGRLVPRKGLGDVLTALADVPGAELVVLGGPAAEVLAADPAAAQVQAAAAARGVADRVRLVGRGGREEVAAWVRSADVVVCAPWYEPFGIVPLEAMACGVPVVGTGVGGLTDTVVDGGTGLLVPPRDPAALAAALRTLLTDPALGRRLGAAGRERVVTTYDWQEVARMTEDAYRRLPRPRPAVAR